MKTEDLIKAYQIPTNSILYKYSNPKAVQRKAYAYLGKDATVYKSTNQHKKYMVHDPHNNHWVHFGQLGYEDFTKHKNLIRKNSYLNRSASIAGDWKTNKYSPNNLSRNILW